jgi:glutamyl-tRNA reductase
MIDLGDLRACLWRTASLSRRDYDCVRAASRFHAPEAVLVESCQRLEVYGFGDCACEAPSRLRGRHALLQLAGVAAGLHSAVLGEEQVMGQVRSALANAPPAMREAGNIAVAAARELRQRTPAESDSGQLLDIALSVANVPASGTLLVLGTGHMARLITRRALNAGFDHVIVSGRRRPDQAWLDHRSVTFVELEAVRECRGIAVTASCLGPDAPVMDIEDELPPAAKLVLDLGTPRNLTTRTDVATMDIATLTDINERQTRSQRARLLTDLEAIVERRVTMASATGASAVGSLRASIERVRQGEVKRIARLHPEIATETVDAITRSLVNKIFHLPSRKLACLDDEALSHQFARLFHDDANMAGRDPE